MTAAEFEDWVEALQRRIRNGCRAVAQALNKDKVWARRLFEDYGLDEEQADEDDDARDHDGQEDDQTNVAQDAAPSTDILGFDEELLLPWRQRGAGAPKDLGLPLPCGGKPRDEPAVASWPDGFSARIPELTWGHVQDLTGGRVSMAGVLFRAEHSVTKHAVTVAQRLDRRLLLSLYEQSRQVLQIPVSKFGPVEDETKRVDENHPSLLGALDVMIPIAKKFANNELSRGDLKKARDSAMNDVSFGPKTRPSSMPQKTEAAK